MAAYQVFNPRVVDSYIGASTDTKPTTAAVGAMAFETDTGTIYQFDGTTWQVYPIAVTGSVTVGSLAIASPVGRQADASSISSALSTEDVVILNAQKTDLDGIKTDTDTLVTVLPAARGANGGLKIEGVSNGTVVPVSLPNFSALNITDTADHIVKNSAGTLARVILNTAAATSTLKVYNGTTAGGTLLATIDGTGATPQPLDYMISCGTGIFAKATGTADWTVVYN